MNSKMKPCVTIRMTGITEENKSCKLNELQKALSNKPYEKIPAYGGKPLPDMIIRLKDFDRTKIDKALRSASFTLDVPLKANSGEGFNYKAQEQLTDRWYAYFSRVVRNTYDFVIDYFGLPKITVMSKSGELKWKGKILYSPESGEPIKQSDWEHFVKTLDKFLNRNVSNASEKIVLNSKTLGKLLDRMLKTNTLAAIKKQSIEEMKFKGKTFDWISDSVKNMKTTFGDSLTRQEMARIQVIQQSAAEKITRTSDAMKNDIKQILVDGVMNKKSKSQISQSLFDKMVGSNRDFQRIADTEIQRTVNNSYLLDEVNSTEEGGKVYFQRIEVMDGNTCPYCRSINNLIAVWSDTPLPSGKVQDRYAEVAIWEGKEWEGKKLTRIEDVPCGVCHPYCRGSWIRYYPETDSKIKDLLEKK